MFQRHSFRIFGLNQRVNNPYLLPGKSHKMPMQSVWKFRVFLNVSPSREEWSTSRSQQHEVGAQCICGLPGDEVRTSTNGFSFIYTLPRNPQQPHPQSAGRGGRACCWALGPVYRRGWARSRLTKHWGPLNISEWPQLYWRPSESQQSAENQNNIKNRALSGGGEKFKIWLSQCFSCQKGEIGFV